MLKLRLSLVTAIAALIVPACDRSEPEAPATLDHATTLSAPTTTTAEQGAGDEPAEPDDGAKKVEIDPETGWPVAISTGDSTESSDGTEPASSDESDSTATKRSPRRKAKPKFAGNPDEVIDLFGGSGAMPRADRMAETIARGEKLPASDGETLRQMRKRKRRVKRAELPIQHETVRKEVAETFIKDGQPSFNLDEIREKQPRWNKLAREAEMARSKANEADDEPRPLQNDGKFSTFGVDVDTGSYALSLGRMRRGYPPRPETVRAEEWLNAFHYEHEVPKDEAFSVQMEAGPNPLKPDEHLLRVNVAGKSVADNERPAAHLTFVVDVSGSMFGPDKLDLIKEALTYLARRLRPDDTIALVTYARETGVLLWPTPATETDKIVAAIGQLEPGGSTDMEHGLKMGYAVAFRESHYEPGDIHRVVLLGDGRANVGSTNPATILGPISNAVEKGIMLSTIGFGAREFNDRLMEQLANQGNGNYTFIDSFKDVRRVFGEQLCGTLYVIGKDAKIQLEFNQKRVKSWELIGYENRKLATEDFRDDDVDAGEIGAGHQVTALYRLELDPDASGDIATARFRWQDPESDDVRELESKLDAVGDADEVSPDFKFAAAVAGAVAYFDEDDERDPEYSFADVRRFAEEGLGDNPKEQPARLEFIELVRKLEPLMK